MSAKGWIRNAGGWLLVAAACASAYAQTDISTVPLNTYSAPSSTDVKPNVLFVLDDSGSMDWDYMPDWADDNSPPDYLYKNSSFNGVAYNPAVRYDPPVTFTAAGVLSTTTYPSMTGMSTSAGANSSSKPNWNAVKNDGYGVQSSSSTKLSNSAESYTIIPGEYCNSPSMRNCITASAPSGQYKYPAYLRWCSDNALTNCVATYGSTYNKRRAPAPRSATITLSGSNSTSVSGITVDGLQIMSGTASSSTSSSTVAQNIVDKINACSTSLSDNCQVAGYTASRSSSTITILAPGLTSATPQVSKSGNMTFSATQFAKGAVPGENLHTVIIPSIDSYPFPGTSAKAAGRTDCAGTTCTYVEEMTNYANWWAYYHTRMQMMKTAASNAFATIDTDADQAANVSRFRLGYLSLNNNTGKDFLNLGEFKTSQKYAWYNKLQSAIPNSGTPLRSALSIAGTLYAGKLNGSKLNAVTVSDPLQYSCQQNYTILSTDGFWNGASGYELDGSQVGNQDAALPRPMYDGATTTVKTRTSTLQKQTQSIQLQTRTRTLQKSTRPDQKRTSSNSGSSWTSWATVTLGSCTAVSSGKNQTQCRTGDWGSWSNASSCTEDNNTQCRYTDWSSWSNTNSCTAQAQSTASPYTVATGVECRNYATNTSSWVNADSCTTSDTVNCQYTSWTSWSTVASCTPSPQSSGPAYTVATARECQSQFSGGTSDTLADVAAYYYATDLRSSDSAKGTGTCTGPVIAPSTTPNDLCVDNVPSNGMDVATTQHMTTFTLGLGAQGQMVYSPTHWTDTSGDFYDVKMGTTANTSSGICSWQTSGSCNWPTPSSDSIANIDDLWHAAINGRGSYFSATDPASLSSGLKDTLATIVNTPRPGTAAAAASSNPNITSSDNYVFSSSYKSVEWYGELIRQQIDNNGVLTQPQWSAMRLLDCATTPWGAGTSYVQGSNFSYANACYTVNTAYSSGTEFGAIDMANTQVISGTPVTRTIYTRGSSGLMAFTWDNLSAAQRAYFNPPNISSLSQFCSNSSDCLSSTAQTNTTIASGGAGGEALVGFLRGERSNEGSFYRSRVHVLGDIVASEARYVKVPLFRYNDSGYADYKVLHANRAGMVYVGANDGMLHAFSAESGQEAWAYVPSMVLPDLYKLADKDYANKHQFYVDNSPEVGDICPNAPSSACNASQWRTILIGGLNRGGKGYFALDITNPANPVLLWEFTDTGLGYTYGNPKITKLKDGTWAVIFTSGYNNADGVGRLYIRNAYTGAAIRTISTGAGSATSPSGLARISAHALEPMTNNTTTAVYGGDLLGNLWRFDINGDIGASGYDAQLLVTFKDAANKVQPITAKPLEATINGKPVVYVGTGRYLGVSDIADTQTETFYAVRDQLDDNTYASPRSSGSGFVAQPIISGTCPADAPTTVCNPGQTVRKGSSNPVNWNTASGFYVDFLTGGERASTDPTLGLGTLLFTTVTPLASSASACGVDTPDGSASYLYALDYLSGGAVVGSTNVVGMSLGVSMVTRPILVGQSDGAVRALIRASNGGGSGVDLGTTLVRTPPIKPLSADGVRRVSWRELVSK